MKNRARTIVAIAALMCHACASLPPIAREACTYARQVCWYADKICLLVQDTTVTRQEILCYSDSLERATNQLRATIR